MESSGQPAVADVKPTDSLLAVLKDLSGGGLTGNKALETIKRFMVSNEVASSEETDSMDHFGLSLQEVFFRVLDKNLKAGIAQKTLQAVHWTEAPTSTTANTYAERPGLQSQNVLQSPTRLSGFSCALGKTVLRKDLARLTSLPADLVETDSGSSLGPKWLASRKLDGVRLFVVIDVLTPDPSRPDSPGQKVLDIWTISRSGKEYYTLDVLKQGLSNSLRDWSRLANILEHEPHYPASQEQTPGFTQRLVLDGELCHLNDSGDPDHPTEDFTQVVSMVRRKDYTIERPVLFLLDVLPWSVFVDGMGKDADGSAEKYKVFAERVLDCEALAKRVFDVDGEYPVVRRLEQIQVNTIKQVKDMMGVAAKRGWEGIILRRSDVPYVGKRKYVEGEYVETSAAYLR